MSIHFINFMSIIGIMLVITFLVTSCVLCARREREAFEEKFPPISDTEFLARCRPGTNPIVALKVRRILSESLGVEYERIYPGSRLVEDLGAN